MGPAELLTQAEKLVAQDQLREAWRRLDTLRSNFPLECRFDAPVWKRADERSHESHHVGRVQVATWPNWAAAALSLTFDDRLSSHVDVVRPDLDQLKMPGTFFVIREHESLPDLTPHDWSKWQSLAASEHEIGNHTDTHPPHLPAQSAASIVDQLEGCNAFIRRLNPEANPTSFAYPFGRHGPVGGPLRRQVRHRFLAGRSTHVTATAANPATPREMDALRSYSLEPSQTEQQIRTRLEEAISSEGWLIITSHKVVEGEGFAGISRAQWEAFLQCLVERRDAVWIATMRDIAWYIQARRSALVVCEPLGDHELRLSVKSQLPAAAPLSTFFPRPLEVAIRVPKTWRQVALVEPGGEETRHSVRENHVRLSVCQDGRLYSLRCCD